MRVRLLLVLVLSLGVAGLGAVLWSSTRPAPLPPAAPASTKSETPPEPLPSISPATAPAPVTPKRVSDGDAKSGKHWWDGFVPGKRERVARAEPEKAEVVTVAIDGIVVLVDADGREHLDLDGTLSPGFYEPQREPAPDADPPPAMAKASFKNSRRCRPGEDVAVESGRFHADVPADREFGATQLKVGGRSAIVDSEPLKVVAGQTVTIRAHWVDGVRVRVVDKESGASLDDVAVVRKKSGMGWSMGDTDPGDPAEFEAVVEHGHSPVLIPPRDQSRGIETQARVWIRARDHAWSGLEIDFADRSERTVALVGAAALVVDVQGELPPASPAAESDEGTFITGSSGEYLLHDAHERDPKVRLRKPPEFGSFDDMMKKAIESYDQAKASDFPSGRKPSLAEFKTSIEAMREEIEAEIGHGELVAERSARPGELRFDSIAAQELIATIEVGESYRSPLVLASATAKLVAGETTRVALVARKIEAPQAVALSGSIFVPRGWDLDKLRLDIEPVGLKGRTSSDEHRLPSKRWTPAADRPGWYRWSAGTVPAAKYVIQVEGAGLVKLVDVAGAGDKNVEIVLPDAATLRVRVVASTHGKPVHVEHLLWRPRAEQETLFGSQGVSLDYDAARGCYEGRVPVGPGTLTSFLDESWEFDEEEPGIDVHSGSQELVVHVHPTCGAIFDLACGGAKVPWDEHAAFEVKLTAIEGGRGLAWSSFRDGHPVIAVRAAGRYTVTFPALEGFDAVAPFEIEIPSGEFVTKTVELRKK